MVKEAETLWNMIEAYLMTGLKVFLTNRTQKVKYNNNLSVIKSISAGPPWVLPYLLFYSYYLLNLNLNIPVRERLRCYFLFADDIQLL